LQINITWPKIKLNNENPIKVVNMDFTIASFISVEFLHLKVLNDHRAYQRNDFNQSFTTNKSSD